MNWDSVPNEAINIGVHKIAKSSEVNYRAIAESCIGSSTFNDPKPIVEAIPNYCNLWADMGSIIEREKISLNFAQPRCTASYWSAAGPMNKNKEVYECVFDANPLRAAAIVYLMMNGVKPEGCK